VVEGDIRNILLLNQTFKSFSVDAVIHLAGLKAVSESVGKPLKCYENNVQKILSLLKAMNEDSIKNLVLSSSATVYGGPKYLPIGEAHQLGSTNPYGRIKYQIEQILEGHAKVDHRFKVVSLRYFNPVVAHVSGLLGVIQK